MGIEGRFLKMWTCAVCVPSQKGPRGILYFLACYKGVSGGVRIVYGMCIYCAALFFFCFLGLAVWFRLGGHFKIFPALDVPQEGYIPLFYVSNSRSQSIR